jgi:hypothetical protein
MWEPESYWHTNLELFTYKNPQGDYLRLNINQINNSCEDYLLSNYPTVFGFKRTCITGLNALKFEANRIVKKEILVIRAYHLFYEHKVLMAKRIKT